MSDVKSGCSDGRDSHNHTHETAVFGDRVDYHHNGVLSIGFQEFCDEINTYGIPWCVGNREQMQFPHWRLFDCFGMETHVTGGDIFAYVSRHLWPPVIPGYQLQSFPSSRVSVRGHPQNLIPITKSDNSASPSTPATALYIPPHRRYIHFVKT